MKGYVYVVYVGDNLYKIGKTIDIKRGIEQSEENRIVRVIGSNNITELEKKLHNTFHKKRLTKSQDLFKLNDEDLLYIHKLHDENLDDNLSLF